MIDADLSLDSSRSIALWAIANLSLEDVRELGPSPCAAG